VETFRKAKEAFGWIDVVFNNAAVGLMGEVEGSPEDVSRYLFDVNFWGALAITKEAIRFFREENPPGLGGRLLVSSSQVSILGVAGVGVYSAS
jgi:NAD(P)-dependent dehydrogenase (short-subunit alcohol dehydrogenase family)